MNWDHFLTTLAGWLEQRGLLTPDSGWVIGASGGPDSTLLLHAMQAVAQRCSPPLRITAVHFNHGLRGAEADRDEEFVRGVAEQLRLEFRAARDDIRARAQREGGSMEEIARRERYVALERIALQTDSPFVAVGHHADDNAETVLHRICRGTGLRGLAGIGDARPIRPGSRVQLVRPLIELRRTQIEALCAARNLHARMDSTNASPEFTRNRIRHAVLPLLRRELNPNVSDALLRLAEQARWLGSYLEEAAARVYESLLVNDGSERIVLHTPALLSKHRAIQAEVVRRTVGLVAGGEQDLGFTHVESVLRLAADAGSGKELHLPGAVAVRKQYDRLEFGRIEPDAAPLELPTVPVACPGTTALPALGAELVATICEVDAGKIEELRGRPPVNEAWLDAARLRPPLVLRARREGEKFHPLGAPGAKSLSDFLIDEKIEPAERARIGVLCDQDGPLWIMPLRIDERAKLTGQTRQAVRFVLRPPVGR